MKFSLLAGVLFMAFVIELTAATSVDAPPKSNESPRGHHDDHHGRNNDQWSRPQQSRPPRPLVLLEEQTAGMPKSTSQSTEQLAMPIGFAPILSMSERVVRLVPR
jgi:hypothetical protein